ncbi:NAD(P)-dependent oxidoreductase [Sediminivirga luteola]|uniref:NAD(P)-dependent oxidoreductase n=1 Tax=Sediminivirga luteola TaxID=1774748 RepID=UPI001F58F5B3|nr:NAD(P)-dependent oxidoreductase [Sediminivirga luteola]MCI2266213.1 NAD(P)-dependent oxidoreductase [Sediminivirga luteola]
MVLVLFGASGHVGRALAPLLSDRYEVVGVSRAEYGDWTAEPGPLLEVLAGREVHGAVAALGGWFVGAPLLDAGPRPLDGEYESHLAAHAAACWVSRELARRQGRGTPLVHIALGGIAGIEPCVGSGAISVFGAAQEMLIRVTEAEARAAGEPVVFRELKILAPVRGDDRNELAPGQRVVEPEEIAGRVRALLREPGGDWRGTLE